jgi:hypothetical protein
VPAGFISFRNNRAYLWGDSHPFLTFKVLTRVMKKPPAFFVTTSLLLSVALALVGSTEASFAAATAKASPKATAKASPKATAKSTAKATPKASAKTTFPSPSGAPGAGAGGRFGNVTTAQRACLAKEGVTLPTAGARPTTRPTGAPNANGAPPNFGGGGTLNSPKTTAAFKKCKIDLPAAGGPGGFNIDPKKLAAFQKCMTAAGIKSANGFQFDQSDPDTAIALIKCQKSSGFTLPNFGQRGANN